MNSMKNWKPYEIVWLICFVSVAIILAITWGDTWFGFSVFITGVLCVVFAAKGNILTYVFGMYNTFGYAYIAWRNHLYGEMGLNLLFFVPMNVVGYVLWKRHINDNNVEMRQLPKKAFVFTCIICVVLIALLGVALSQIPSQNNAYMDATTNILSIFATMLMVLRYKEQWVMYIVLNIVTVTMWSIRLYNGSPDGLTMVFMWSAYLINAIYGYINWSIGAGKGMEER